MDGEQQSARHDGVPIETPAEHAEHEHPDAPPGGTGSHAPGGGVGSVAGGPGEGVPGGPQATEREGEQREDEPPATDSVAYDDHRDDFPEGRRPAG